jgi:hypothetical protein
MFKKFTYVIVLAVMLSLMVASLASARQSSTWELSFNPLDFGFKDLDWYANPPGGGWIGTMGVFKQELYIFVSSIGGAKIFHSADGVTWEAVTGTGLNEMNWVSWDMTVFGEELYIPVFSYAYEPGLILRTADGETWETVSNSWEGSLITNPDKMGAYKGMVYVTAFQYPIFAGSGPAQLWRSSNGDPNSWELVEEFGQEAWHTNGLDEYQGMLYISVQENEKNITIWRSPTGDPGSWEMVVDDGFQNVAPYEGIKNGGEFCVFQGWLYFTNGPDILRTHDGLNWELVEAGGFGDVNNSQVTSLIPYQGDLYAFTLNNSTGIEVWSSPTGETGTWTQINEDAFGDVLHNHISYQGDQAVFKGKLFVGTDQYDTWLGGVWKLSHH